MFEPLSTATPPTVSAAVAPSVRPGWCPDAAGAQRRQRAGDVRLVMLRVELARASAGLMVTSFLGAAVSTLPPCDVNAHMMTTCWHALLPSLGTGTTQRGQNGRARRASQCAQLWLWITSRSDGRHCLSRSRRERGTRLIPLHRARSCVAGGRISKCNRQISYFSRSCGARTQGGRASPTTLSQMLSSAALHQHRLRRHF